MLKLTIILLLQLKSSLPTCMNVNHNLSTDCSVLQSSTSS